MSYTLGNITLPYPKRFTREFIETGAKNLLIEGISTKKVENRKERFTLEFQHLTPSEVNSIVSEYELDSVREFTVDETNLSISVTRVLIDITGRNYPLSGDLYRENITLVLTEII
jgi:hypothetical protein